MRIGKHFTLRRVFILGLGILFLALIFMIYLVNSYQITIKSEAERLLTVAHGPEVQATIENFELRWFSLDAHEDPSIQAKLATGPYLDYWRYARHGKAIYDEPWWITKQAMVTSFRTFEYTPEHFKTIARVTRLFDEVTPQGEFKRSLPPNESCGVYVFVREDDVWKLATYFDMSVPQDIDRDWRDAPAWSKQLIGDLPRDMCDG